MHVCCFGIYIFYIIYSDIFVPLIDLPLPISSLDQSMALHIVRSLGQAFDVCHRLNPKSKKPKQTKEGEEKVADREQGEASKGKEADEAGGESIAPPASAGEGAGEAGTDLEAPMQKLNLENGTVTKTKPSSDMDFSKDLLTLQFDPFVFGTPAQNLSNTFVAQSDVPNGAPLGALDPFQSPYFITGSGVPPAPLTVANTSMNLPDFPVEAGKDGSRIVIPPPHAHLAYRPRPRPSTTSQQVYSSVFPVFYQLLYMPSRHLHFNNYPFFFIFL